MKKAFDTGIFAYKVNAITKLKTVVIAAETAQRRINAGTPLVDPENQVHYEKVRAFKNENITPVVFKLEIMKEIMIDYLNTYFDLKNTTNTTNVRALAFINSNIIPAVDENALFAAYGLIITENATTPILPFARKTDKLLPELSLRAVIVPVYAIINLLYQTNVKIKQEIDNNLNLGLMSQVNTDINKIVNDIVVSNIVNPLITNTGEVGGVNRLIQNAGSTTARYDTFTPVFALYTIGVIKARYSDITIE